VRGSRVRPPALARRNPTRRKIASQAVGFVESQAENGARGLLRAPGLAATARATRALRRDAFARRRECEFFRCIEFVIAGSESDDAIQRPDARGLGLLRSARNDEGSIQELNAPDLGSPRHLQPRVERSERQGDVDRGQRDRRVGADEVGVAPLAALGAAVKLG